MRHFSVGLTLLLLLSTVGGSQVAGAQEIDGTEALRAWERETGVYVTKAAKDRFPSYQASTFADSAPAYGFQNPEKIAAAMSRGSKLQIEPSNTFGKQKVLTDDIGQRSLIGDERQYAYVLSLFSFPTVASFLEKFATIRLSVQPVPPRDYKVVINGEDCPATEKGEYRVLPGSATINVTRVSKPACTWKGEIPAGKEHLVSCQF